jgi:hypothetical protein
MAVKLLMTWDIRPGREQEYFEFVVREFMPGIQRIGLKPSEAWVTTYGDQPQIMTGMLADSSEEMQVALDSEEWVTLRGQLLEYVINLESKVIEAKGGFQM